MKAYLDELCRPTQAGSVGPEDPSIGILAVLQHRIPEDCQPHAWQAQNTGRPLQEILDAITQHLRSRHNRQLDLREYLSVKQRGGQDNVSLCNEILELGEYANTGILILAMRSEQD